MKNPEGKQKKETGKLTRRKMIAAGAAASISLLAACAPDRDTSEPNVTVEQDSTTTTVSNEPGEVMTVNPKRVEEVYAERKKAEQEQREVLVVSDSLFDQANRLVAFMATEESGVESYNGGYSYGNKSALIEGRADPSLPEIFYHYDPITFDVFLNSASSVIGEDGSEELISVAIAFQLVGDTLDLAKELSPSDLLKHLDGDTPVFLKSSSVSRTGSEGSNSEVAKFGEDGGFLTVLLTNNNGKEIGAVDFVSDAEGVVDDMLRPGQK